MEYNLYEIPLFIAMGAIGEKCLMQKNWRKHIFINNQFK